MWTVYATRFKIILANEIIDSEMSSFIVFFVQLEKVRDPVNDEGRQMLRLVCVLLFPPANKLPKLSSIK